MNMQELLKQKEVEEQKASEKVKNLQVDRMSMEQYMKSYEQAYSKYNEICATIRLNTVEYELEEIPSYGQRMSLKSFIANVKCGGFIDYDGYGNYVKDGKMTDITIYPSDVKINCVRKDFDEIIWFNR